MLHYLHILPLDGWFVLSFEFGATVLGLTCETAAVLSLYFIVHEVWNRLKALTKDWSQVIIHSGQSKLH